MCLGCLRLHRSGIRCNHVKRQLCLNYREKIKSQTTELPTQRLRKWNLRASEHQTSSVPLVPEIPAGGICLVAVPSTARREVTAGHGASWVGLEPTTASQGDDGGSALHMSSIIFICRKLVKILVQYIHLPDRNFTTALSKGRKYQ